MSSYDVQMIPCCVDGCSEETKAHKWAKIKAQEDGWFFAKDGSTYCPQHVPDWVEEWRKRNQR